MLIALTYQHSTDTVFTIGLAALAAFGLGVDPVAIEFLGAQIGIARAADALQPVFVKPGLGHAVGAVLLARLIEAAGRADAADQTERGAVIGDPFLSVRPVR